MDIKNTFIQHKKSVGTPIKLRVFCFHHAGGNANDFRNWADLLPDEIELVAIQLPGRGILANEYLLTSIEEVVEYSANVIGHFDSKPFVLFGHSMGGLVAFELLHRLILEEKKLPKKLIVAARAAPTLKLARKTHDLPLPLFVNSIKDYGGINESIIQDIDLLELFIPALRADTQVYENYEYKSRRPLDIPIDVHFGIQDKMVTRSTCSEWANESSNVNFFENTGNHFFPKNNFDTLVEKLSETLTQ